MDLKKEEKREKDLDKKKTPKKPLFKEGYLSPKRASKDDEESFSTKKANVKTYLDIFQRPSFGNQTRNAKNKYLVDTNLISEQEDEIPKEIKYDYPVNIFKRFLFTWTRKVLSKANKKSYLEISDLGKFHPKLYPDKFLSEIKPIWERFSKKTKNSPLIKTLLYQNRWILLLILIGNIFVICSETLNVLLYRQFILHLDNNTEDKPLFNLLPTMIFLLLNKLLYNFIFRFYESFTI